MHFNCIEFYLLRSPTRFGHSRGHLQGDLLEKKKTTVTKMCITPQY